MGKIGAFEIILILAIAVLLFGGKKIPELMKGLGKGIKGFKDEMKGEDEDHKQGNNSDKK
jgi:sec-independent protein translocase protein TatA